MFNILHPWYLMIADLFDSIPDVELHCHPVLPIHASQPDRHVAVVGVELLLLQTAVGQHEHDLQIYLEHHGQKYLEHHGQKYLEHYGQKCLSNTTSRSVWFLVPSLTNLSVQSMKSSEDMMMQKMFLRISVFIRNFLANSNNLSLNKARKLTCFYSQEI